MPLPRNPDLTSLWLSGPAGRSQAAQAVTQAFAGGASRKVAAERLGVSERTLFRWIAEHVELAALRR